jgi:hypothetical protein
MKFRRLCLKEFCGQASALSRLATRHIVARVKEYAAKTTLQATRFRAEILSSFHAKAPFNWKTPYVRMIPECFLEIYFQAAKAAIENC